MPSSTILLLVRHGETDANVAGTWQGATDHPLNERGRAQAQALARRLAAEHPDIVAIHTSPLRRAHETATIVAEALGGVPVVTDEGLSEYNLGEWEGLTYEELRYERRLWERMAEDPHWAPPGGESAYTFATRVIAAFQRAAQAHPGEKVLVISHGGAIATALALLLEGNGSLWRKYQMINCAITELHFSPQPTLVRFNDVAHLEEVGHGGRPRVAG